MIGFVSIEKGNIKGAFDKLTWQRIELYGIVLHWNQKLRVKMVFNDMVNQKSKQNNDEP